MTKAEVLARLKAHERELRALGVAGLSLFGSTAREDGRANSDVDLAARFSRDARVGMIQFGRLETRIAELLGASIDLVGEPARKPAMQQSIDRDRIVVF